MTKDVSHKWWCQQVSLRLLSIVCFKHRTDYFLSSSQTKSQYQKRNVRLARISVFIWKGVIQQHNSRVCITWVEFFWQAYIMAIDVLNAVFYFGGGTVCGFPPLLMDMCPNGTTPTPWPPSIALRVIRTAPTNGGIWPMHGRESRLWMCAPQRSLLLKPYALILSRNIFFVSSVASSYLLLILRRLHPVHGFFFSLSEKVSGSAGSTLPDFSTEKEYYFFPPVAFVCTKTTQIFSSGGF